MFALATDLKTTFIFGKCNLWMAPYGIIYILRNQIWPIFIPSVITYSTDRCYNNMFRNYLRTPLPLSDYIICERPLLIVLKGPS